MPELKMKRVTKAGLYLNNLPEDIFSIEFDSTDMTEIEVKKEMSKRFDEVLMIKFNESWEPLDYNIIKRG